MKKVLAILLTGLLLFSMVACGKDVEEPVGTETGTETSAPTTPKPDFVPDDDDDKSKPEDDSKGNESQGANGNTIVALNKNTKGIKLLSPRNIPSDTQINCDRSGSGIEFVLDNRSPSVMIEASSSATCRFKVYVNADLQKNTENQEFFTINQAGFIVLSNLPQGTITVRVVKITDQAIATAQLTKVTFLGELKKDSAPANKDLYIEFVGGAEVAGTFASGGTYADQDATTAYGYLLAEQMNADYSIISLGADAALTGDVDLCSLYTKTSPIRDANATYDFARKADMVVVDLGAVDAALSATDNTVTPAAFADKYEALLNTIRQKNGEDCKIVCVYTTEMGEFGMAVRNICRTEMGGQQNGIYLCQRTVGGNGILSIPNSAIFANALRNIAETAIAGMITDRELATGENGEGFKVSFKNDFVPLFN